MLGKEQGYEEFLAEKIRKGREDIANGNVVTKAEFQSQMKNLLNQLEQEQREQEQEFHRDVVYG